MSNGAASCTPQLTRGIEKTVARLVEKLAETSTEVTDEGLADVAAVSAGNNRVVSWRPALPSSLRRTDQGCLVHVRRTRNGTHPRGVFALHSPLQTGCNAPQP
jgi:hypothetical protein